MFSGNKIFDSLAWRTLEMMSRRLLLVRETDTSSLQLLTPHTPATLLLASEFVGMCAFAVDWVFFLTTAVL
jgi:hypothetical protein